MAVAAELDQGFSGGELVHEIGFVPKDDCGFVGCICERFFDVCLSFVGTVDSDPTDALMDPIFVSQKLDIEFVEDNPEDFGGAFFVVVVPGDGDYVSVHDQQGLKDFADHSR